MSDESKEALAAARREGEAEAANAFVRWAYKAEIDEPPLDWGWFGEIARRYSPLHEEYTGPVLRDPEEESAELACAWSDYRKDYGISEEHMNAAHKAFKAGWKAAREGDQSAVLR